MKIEGRYLALFTVIGVCGILALYAAGVFPHLDLVGPGWGEAVSEAARSEPGAIPALHGFI